MDMFTLIVWLNVTHPPLHVGRYFQTKCEKVGQIWVATATPPAPAPDPKAKSNSAKPKAPPSLPGYACLPAS
jgi:hypothetical protein